MLRKETTYGVNVSPALAHLFEWEPNILLGSGSIGFNKLFFSEHLDSLSLPMGLGAR
jgi:hypothetical protein